MIVVANISPCLSNLSSLHNDLFNKLQQVDTEKKGQGRSPSSEIVPSEYSGSGHTMVIWGLGHRRVSLCSFLPSKTGGGKHPGGAIRAY